MLFESRILTVLDKVFLDEAPLACSPCFQGFQNEKIDFQVAFRAADVRWEEVRLDIESPLKEDISVRRVVQVPVRYAIPKEAQADCLRTAPGLYPDLLSPCQPHALHAGPDWSSLWFRVENKNGIAPGVYPLQLSFTDGTGETHPLPEIRLEILPGMLPAQKLIHTKWFHCDGLSQFYGVEVFSEEHWRIIENFLRAAAEGGINMILTPVHTPPLDTRPGGARLTTQLVGIEVIDGQYRFDLSRLRRWIALCKKCGIEYFEVAHLFTQWGAEHAPRIMATVDGDYKQIFGWDTEAAGEAYGQFLQAYIPVLRACFREEGVEEKTYWHISDEPSSDQLPCYEAARRQAAPLLAGCHIIDAISEYEFYSRGLMTGPIPASDRIEPFLEANVPGLWTYYCCGQVHRVSNTFIAFPSYRNRILGVQLFKYAICGFLQWGYNFYNSCLSDYPINPFLTTDADGWVPAGDPFQVYPGENGTPYESIRMAVTLQALQDLRAMEMLSVLESREFVLRLIDEGLDQPVTFSEYPRDNRYLLSLRRKINEEIIKRQATKGGTQ